jgi:hypothetical protein
MLTASQKESIAKALTEEQRELLWRCVAADKGRDSVLPPMSGKTIDLFIDLGLLTWRRPLQVQLFVTQKARDLFATDDSRTSMSGEFGRLSPAEKLITLNGLTEELARRGEELYAFGRHLRESTVKGGDSAPDSEIEDAKSLVKQRGGDPSRFKFHIAQHPLADTGVHAVRYTVTVTCSGISRDYQGGRGLAWLADFETDLRGGWDRA